MLSYKSHSHKAMSVISLFAHRYALNEYGWHFSVVQILLFNPLLKNLTPQTFSKRCEHFKQILMAWNFQNHLSSCESTVFRFTPFYSVAICSVLYNEQPCAQDITTTTMKIEYGNNLVVRVVCREIGQNALHTDHATSFVSACFLLASTITILMADCCVLPLQSFILFDSLHNLLHFAFCTRRMHLVEGKHKIELQQRKTYQNALVEPEYTLILCSTEIVKVLHNEMWKSFTAIIMLAAV